MILHYQGPKKSSEFLPTSGKTTADLPNIIQRILTTFCLDALRTNVIMTVTPENVSHHMKPWAPFLSCTVIPIGCGKPAVPSGNHSHWQKSPHPDLFSECFLCIFSLAPTKKTVSSDALSSSNHFSPIILPSLGSEVRYEFSLSLIPPSGSFFLPSSLKINTVEFQVFKL